MVWKAVGSKCHKMNIKDQSSYPLTIKNVKYLPVRQQDFPILRSHLHTWQIFPSLLHSVGGTKAWVMSQAQGCGLFGPLIELRLNATCLIGVSFSWHFESSLYLIGDKQNLVFRKFGTINSAYIHWYFCIFPSLNISFVFLGVKHPSWICRVLSYHWYKEWS